jgi:hypothetical protein
MAVAQFAFAQIEGLQNFGSQGFGASIPRGAGRGSKIDSLQHRTGKEDSIDLYYKYWDNAKLRLLDSSVNDFTTRFCIPANFVFLGNSGSAARNILFSPNMQPGWDPGFHAFDIYRYTVENSRFYKTSRPYTELGYIIGARSEQYIDIIHTQNIKPLWNFSFQYRLVNAPGEFLNQKTSNSSIRLTSSYQSRNRKYSAQFIYLSNSVKAAQNGGIRSDSFLKDFRYDERFLVPTTIGTSTGLGRDFFSSDITTGIIYNDDALVLKHSYDFGKKDSLQVDTSSVKIFYPKFRIQHYFKLSNYDYSFLDQNVSAVETDPRGLRVRDGKRDYANFFGLLNPSDTIRLRDKWTEVLNEISVLTFPDKENTNQFLRLGAAAQLLKGNFDNYGESYYNIYVTGEYRNQTRNKKWDLDAAGKLYLNGFNAGDFKVNASLSRYVSKAIGYLNIGFENVNRTPSFIFDPLSSFIVTGNNGFGKENTTHLFGGIENEAKQFGLHADYYLINNYTYFDNYFNARQESSPLNLLKITGYKKFRLGRRINWYAEVAVQQTTANSPIRVPLVFTRNRIAYENVLFRNLNLSTGLEMRYHTPYKADRFSPFNGQFIYQDDATISNLPDINFFFHFRIMSFKGFIRAENLNSFEFSDNGLTATRHNFAAPGNPTSSFMIRVGIFWNFVN